MLKSWLSPKQLCLMGGLLTMFLSIACQPKLSTTDNATNTSIPSVTPSITPQPSNTPSATAIPTGTHPPKPSPTAETSIPSCRVGYVTQNYSSQDEYSKLWLLDSRSGNPEQLLTLDANNGLLDSNLAWSHDQSRLVFVQLSNRSFASISVLDVNQKIVTPVYEWPVRQTGLVYSSNLITKNSWSPNDHWLYVRAGYVDPSSGEQSFRDLILEVATGNVQELAIGDEFKQWLPTSGDEYLYTSKTNGITRLSIGKAGSTETRALIDIARYIPDLDYGAISPDGATVLLPAYDPDAAQSVLLLIDLQASRLDMVIKEGEQFFPIAWSSDMKWVALWSSRLLFLDVTQGFEMVVSLEADGVDFIDPKRWSIDGSLFFVQKGTKLLAVNPHSPERPNVILDLQSLGVESDAYISMSLSVAK